MCAKFTNLVSSICGILILLASVPLMASAAPLSQSTVCAKDYTVQVGDSISAIAEKYFGNVSAYPAIVDATNLAAQEDSRYTRIMSADVVEPGQVLCIPSREDAQPISAGQLSSQYGVGSSQVPASEGGHAGTQTVRFSQGSQVSNRPLQVTLTNLTGGTIRYTTNGTLPGADSTPYTGPLNIGAPTVIRAQVFDAAGNPVGDVVTHSYLIVDYAQTIPVISVVADAGDLDTLHAHPTQRGREWERPINIEYFEPGGALGFSVNAGIRIHGGVSRNFSPKKSYRIYFRKSYAGPGKLKYPLFEDTQVTKFDKLILRAGYNDAFTYLNERLEPTVQSTGAAYIRDQVTRNLHRDMGQPIAHGSWVLLYLNGEFWGLYNLTERIDLQFLQSYSDKDSEWDIIDKAVSTETGEWISQEMVRDGNYGGWLDNQN